MTRKDSEKDAERPHYYSQFWLDIAAGRRVIGGPKPEEAEANDVEAPELAPARKAGRSTADTLKETRASAVVEPEIEDEEELDQDTMVEEAEIPTILIDEDADEAGNELAEEDFNDEDEPDEDEEIFEDEEDEDDEEWGRRGGARKKAKPTRPTKPVKKVKRETRRNF